MKNKQINKILFMFVIGMSLLFSCSNAIEINNTYNVVFNANNLPSFSKTTLDSLGNYSLIDAQVILSDYLSGTDVTTFQSLINSIFTTYDEDSYVVYSYYYDTKGYYYGRLYTWNSETTDIAKFGSYLGLVATDDFHYISFTYNPTNSLVASSLVYSNTNSNYVYACENFLTYVDSLTFFESNVDVKLMTYRSSDKTYYWDGSSYYYESTVVPDEPEVPSVNHDLTGLISAITSSDVIKDNIDKLRTEYFIIYTGEAFGEYFYDVYFYDNRIQLAYFEYLDENDRLRYDLNKLFIDGKIESIVSSVLGERLDEWLDNFHFKLSYNPETKNCSVKYVGTKNYADDLEGFSVELTPLVFTSKDIPYYFYEYDEITNQGIATPDTSKDIKTQVIVDSEGNEISSNIENESFSLDETPWTRFVSIIQSIPEKIKSAISEMTGLTKIVTLISPIGSAVLIILGVLLSSISLLGRAIAFVYTLPTIKSSDALFLADVDATTGLVFTGNSWGIRFLEGLNMVKEFSWNGLNLWTLFTSFIVAMFAIHCVKIVRKHYHY